MWPVLLLPVFSMFYSVVAGEENNDQDDQEFKSGEREAILGKFLPVMQEISNFVDRCYALTLNFVQQLGSLFNAKDPVYRSLFSRSHVRVMFTRLAELLVVLITIDSIIQSNTVLHGKQHSVSVSVLVLLLLLLLHRDLFLICLSVAACFVFICTYILICPIYSSIHSQNAGITIKL